MFIPAIPPEKIILAVDIEELLSVLVNNSYVTKYDENAGTSLIIVSPRPL